MFKEGQPQDCLAGTRDVKSDDRRRKKLGLSGVWLKFQCVGAEL
jgi:hypothetical protein